MKGPYITLTDDTVRIERILSEWSDSCVYLAVGEGGMYYNHEGKRTFLLCFNARHELIDTPQAREFAFDTRAEIERFLTDLPRRRKEQ
jgi:hypothetical protein